MSKLKVVSEVEQDGIIIKTFSNGTIIKTPIPSEVTPIEVQEQLTLEDKINYLFYKEQGVIQ